MIGPENDAGAFEGCVGAGALPPNAPDRSRGSAAAGGVESETAVLGGGHGRNGSRGELALPKPFYSDASVTIYCGDMRAIVPKLTGIQKVITDPPYEETSLAWDSWPVGWPLCFNDEVRQLWCFGSFRMFLEQRDQFCGWRLGQDIVWEKHNGSGMAVDRFRRVHELAAHFYRGRWDSLYRAKPTIQVHEVNPRKSLQRSSKPTHWGEVKRASTYKFEGKRIRRSVMRVRSCHGSAPHPTQKPAGIILPLIEYSVPLGGCVLDPFMGSGAILRAAKESGRRAVGIEADRHACEKAAEWLSQGVLAPA